MDVRDWAYRYARAWETRDAEAAAALFTEDATYRSSPFEEPYRGRDGVRRYWSEVTSTQENVEVAIGRMLVDGNQALVEWWTQMENGGTPVTLPGSLLLDFDDSGLCQALREYWNLEIGARIPPHDGWGA